MKKVLLFTLLAIAISSISYGQIDKGTVLTGGNLYFNTGKSENTYSPAFYKEKSTLYSFSPSVGIAFKPNAIIGVELGYYHSRTKSESNPGVDKINQYSAQVFLRRYITLGKGFYLFAQPGLYFNTNKSEYNRNINSEQTNNSWSVGVNIYPGISYAVSKRFHLEAGIGNMANIYYSSSKVKYNPNVSSGSRTYSKSNSFTFSSSLSNNNSISLGFRFFLPKKTKLS